MKGDPIAGVWARVLGWLGPRRTKLREFDPAELLPLTEGAGAPRTFIKHLTTMALAREENQYPGAMFQAARILGEAGELESAKALAGKIADPAARECAFEQIAGACAYGGRVQEALAILHELDANTQPRHLSSRVSKVKWANNLVESGRLSEALELAHALESSDREMIVSSIVQKESCPTPEVLARIYQVSGADPMMAHTLESLSTNLATAGRLQEAITTAAQIRDESRQAGAFQKIAVAIKSDRRARDYYVLASTIQDEAARDIALGVAADLLVKGGDLQAAVEAASAIRSHSRIPPPFFCPRLDGKSLSESAVLLGERIGNRAVLQSYMEAVARALHEAGRLEMFANAAEKCSVPARDLAFHTLVREFIGLNDFARAKEYNARVEEGALRSQGLDCIARVQRKAETSPAELIEQLKTRLLAGTGAPPTLDIVDVVVDLLKHDLKDAAKDAFALVNLVRPDNEIRLRDRKLFLQGIAFALCRDGDAEGVLAWLVELERPEDREVLLKEAASHLARQGNLESLEKCLSRMENPETVEDTCSSFASSMVKAGRTHALLPRIACLKETRIRDELRMAMADKLMGAGQFAAGKEFLDQLETEMPKEREPKARRPPATQQDAVALKALDFKSAFSKARAARALAESGFTEEAIQLAAGVVHDSERSQLVWLGLNSKTRQGDIEGAIRLALTTTRDRSQQFDSLIQIARTLDEATNSEHLSRVLLEAFKIPQTTRDEGKRALQLIQIGWVIASRPTVSSHARELKREFSASDKAFVRRVLQLLPG